MYEIVKVNLLDKSEAYLPGDYATVEEAWKRIRQYERSTGQEPGCDHGFGTGSGFKPRERT